MRVAVLLLLLLAGCSHARPSFLFPQLITIDKAEEPDPTVPNVFERRKAKCLEVGKRPIEAWENDVRWRCNCVPFNAGFWRE